MTMAPDDMRGAHTVAPTLLKEPGAIEATLSSMRRQLASTTTHVASHAASYTSASSSSLGGLRHGANAAARGAWLVAQQHAAALIAANNNSSSPVAADSPHPATTTTTTTTTTTATMRATTSRAQARDGEEEDDVLLVTAAPDAPSPSVANANANAADDDIAVNSSTGNSSSVAPQTRDEQQQRIVFARWITLGPARQVLLVAYQGAGLALWDLAAAAASDKKSDKTSASASPSASARRCVREVANLRTVADSQVGNRLTLVDGAALEQRLVLLAHDDDDEQESVVLLVDLELLRVVKHTRVPLARATSLVVARSTIVVSAPCQRGRGGVHILTPDLVVTRVISDACAPACALSSKGRMLAYVSDHAPRYTDDEREPVWAPGTGLIARRGAFNDDDDADDDDDELGDGGGGGGGLRAARRTASDFDMPTTAAALARSARRVGENVVAATASSMSRISMSAPSHLSPSPSLSSPAAAASRPPPPQPLSGCSVVVQDLQTGRKLAHFVSSSAAAAPSVLSFSPNASQLLVGAPSARHFDILELRPASPPATSASERRFRAKAWHRYRLSRGLTRAQVASVTWSDDGRLVAICTTRGTCHLYAIQPYGGGDGAVDFAPRIINPSELQGLSVSLSPFARIRPRECDDDDGGDVTAPSVLFARDPTRSRGMYMQDVYAFYGGAAGRLVLVRLAPVSVHAGALAQTPAERREEHRPRDHESALTHMLKSAAVPMGAVSVTRKAEWRVARHASWPELALARSREEIAKKQQQQQKKKRTTTTTVGARYSAQAEVGQTTPLVTASIYGVRQFDFYELGRTGERLRVRHEVRVRRPPGLVGDGQQEGRDDVGRTMQSAILSELDDEGAAAPGVRAGFPNGVPATHHTPPGSLVARGMTLMRGLRLSPFSPEFGAGAGSATAGAHKPSARSSVSFEHDDAALEVVERDEVVLDDDWDETAEALPLNEQDYELMFDDPA